MRLIALSPIPRGSDADSDLRAVQVMSTRRARRPMCPGLPHLQSYPLDVGNEFLARPAVTGDAVAIVALREAAARWLLRDSIAQWHAGEVTVNEVATQILRNEWYSVRQAGQVIAAVRVSWEDLDLWPNDLPAGYIHGLVIDRQYAGHQLGEQLLAHVERLIAGTGRALARLDCVASNTMLQEYYAARGYSQRGIVTFDPPTPWYPAMRFEKLL